LRQCLRALLNQDLGDDGGQMKKEAHITFIKIKVIMGELSTQGPIDTSVGTSGSRSLKNNNKTKMPRNEDQVWTQ